MATANTSLDVSSLGFFEIKENLKSFLRGKPEFTDFDFEGSTMSTLLDVLAYNTYYNSFYLNMIANEMFLDSTTLPASAYSISKMLNYTPRSARSSYAQIKVTFSPNDAPDEIVIPKYTKFNSTINGTVYTFTTDTDYSVFPENGYAKTLDIYEGIVLSYRFTYTAGHTGRFEIPVLGVDTESMVVELQATSASTTKTIYTLVTDATEVGASSRVYYLQKNSNGFYEIYFGDGILGKELVVGNVITVTYRACNGDDANKAAKFTPIGYSGYNKLTPTTKYNATIATVVQSAADGQDEESLNSIKFNASRSYEIQNRLITASDYKQYILNNYSDIQSVSVWGGEDHVPPIYGKTLISVKPYGSYVMSSSRKNNIINDVQKYSAMSIDPAIIDPTFLFISPSIVVNYDSRLMATSVQSLFTRVSSAVKSYESTNLGQFGNSFRSSKLSAIIDNADGAIVSNELSIKLEKRFVPVINSKFTYKIDFFNELKHPYDGYVGALNSTGFKVIEAPTRTMFLDDNGSGIVRMYYFSGSTKKYHNTNVGTINYITGELILKSMTFVDYDNEEIRVIVEPAKPDIKADRNQIILLAYPLIQMYDINTNTVIYSETIDVLGNTTLVDSSGILNTVTL